MVIGSLLLGVAMVCPSFLVYALFPIPAQHKSYALETVSFPLAAFFLHVFPGPLVEELVYRGLFLQIARRYMPTGIAIGLVSIVFALTHTPRGPANVLNAFLMSLIISWIFVRSGSLISGYVFHATLNYAALFVISPMFNLMDKLMAVTPGSRIPVGDILPTWWIGISLAMGVGAMILLKREFVRRKAGLGSAGSSADKE